MNDTTGTRLETLPTTWDLDREERFFRVVANLFPTGFTFGASVLLASYDDETPELVPDRTTDVPRPCVFGRVSDRLFERNPHSQ